MHSYAQKSTKKPLVKRSPLAQKNSAKHIGSIETPCIQYMMNGLHFDKDTHNSHGNPSSSSLNTVVDLGGNYEGRGRYVDWRSISPMTRVLDERDMYCRVQMIDKPTSNSVTLMQMDSSQNVRGLGATGLFAASMYAQQQGRNRVTLTATGENNNGGFYERFGFVRPQGESINRINAMRALTGQPNLNNLGQNYTLADENQARANALALANNDQNLTRLINLARYSGQYEINRNDLMQNTLTYLTQNGWSIA